MARYEVFEGFMEDLRKKVKRVENKCKKYDCTFSYKEVDEVIKEFPNPKYDPKIDNGEEEFVYFKFIGIEVEGTAIKNDWEFVASIEHLSTGNLYHKLLTDIEIPTRYRNCAPKCEHCNTSRPRKVTYIVHNVVTDEFKQLASSCIKDYTRGLNAELFALYASIKSVFAEEEERFAVGGGYSEFLGFKVENILAYVSETIRCLGYARSTDEYGNYNPFNTAKVARLLYCEDNLRSELNKYDWQDLDDIHRKIDEKNLVFNGKSEEAQEEVKVALEWLNKQEDASDYIHNLQVIANQNYVGYRNLGLLCSVIPVAYKALKRLQEQEAREQAHKKQVVESNYVGTVGERSDFALTFVREARFENEWGIVSVCTFTDKNGNVFVWKTQGIVDFKPERAYTLKGTIKEHKEYRGVKQTVITRCKVVA